MEIPGAASQESDRGRREVYVAVVDPRISAGGQEGRAP